METMLCEHNCPTRCWGGGNTCGSSGRGGLVTLPSPGYEMWFGNVGLELEIKLLSILSH